MLRLPNAARVLAVALIAVGALVGCSDSKPRVCSDVDNLKKSVQSLRDVSIGAGTVSEVQSDLAQVKQDLVTLRDDAKAQFSADVDKLSTALDSASASVTAARQAPNTSTLSAVRSALRAVVDAGSNLITSVSNTC